jgi:tRNA pseudouridine55 synthase
MRSDVGELPVLDRHTGLQGAKEGVAILVDKPQGWSSFKVVKLIRSTLGIKKVGHAGTLDPMATGLLICCVGRSATRRIDEFMGLDKEYVGAMRLGETTPSHDAESSVTERQPAEHITETQIVDCFRTFVGELQQIPPMFSAIRVGGRRLYDLARKGETVDRAPRTIFVHEFDFLSKSGSDVHFRVVCSKGTYIRSLAHDVGRQLGVGAHLVRLRRTKIGSFSVDDALTTSQIVR